mmetsp:Transcript_12056/g.29121  ORF Transcript_12056/g.29121 Transcript_12056/m.29121 type:complete len:219 (+) Transcript_12056:604-1260(+)
MRHACHCLRHVGVGVCPGLLHEAVRLEKALGCLAHRRCLIARHLHCKQELGAVHRQSSVELFGLKGLFASSHLFDTVLVLALCSDMFRRWWPSEQKPCPNSAAPDPLVFDLLFRPTQQPFGDLAPLKRKLQAVHLHPHPADAQRQPAKHHKHPRPRLVSGNHPSSCRVRIQVPITRVEKPPLSLHRGPLPLEQQQHLEAPILTQQGLGHERRRVEFLS